MADTLMSIGSYDFSPVPLMSLSKEYIRTADGTAIGETTTITLNGTLVASPQLSGQSGLDAIDEAIDELRDALKVSCALFLVQCDSTDIVRARPRIKSFSVEPSSNNWIFTAPYTIELEFETEVSDEDVVFNPDLKEASEEWTLEFAEENQFTESGGADGTPYTMRLTHNVSAKSTNVCASGGVSSYGWQEAQRYVVGRLGFNNGVVASGASGVFNIGVTGLGRYNHMRQNSINERDGGYSVTETWLLVNTGQSGLAGNALEDFTATIRTSRTEPLTTVTVEGSIQGLETRSYGSNPGDFTITTDKYASALSYWNTVKNRLYTRANAVAGSLDRGLSTIPTLSSVGHAKPKGIINYTYEYDNRVCFLLDAGSLSGQILDEIITITDNYPTDVFAVLPILGRATGPVLVEMSTVTESSREVSIEVIAKPPTGCSLSSWNTIKANVKDGVQELLCEFEAELTGVADQVFKTADRETWIPQQGKYSRNVAWTYQECDGSGNTSMC